MTFGLKRNIVFFIKKLFVILFKKYKLHIQFLLKQTMVGGLHHVTTSLGNTTNNNKK